MRHSTKATAAFVVAILALAAGGCSKAPAEAAIKAAQQALETATPELEKYAPDELASLATAIREAQARFDKGSYTEALKAAQPLPSKIEESLARANGRKEELAATWTEMSRLLPGLIAALSTRIAELGAGGKLPKGMDRSGAEMAKNDLAAITGAWAAAGDAFRGGDIPRAVRTARDVRAKAEQLAAAIGLDAAAAAPRDAGPVM